jgi:hypothetical protein
MNPPVSKTCWTSHGENRNHVAEAAGRPIRWTRTEPEHVHTSPTTAASGPKDPTHKPGQVPKAVATDFKTSLGEQRQTGRHTVRRPLHRGFEIGLPDAVGRKDYHLNDAEPQ